MIIQVVKVSIRPEQRDRWLELIRLNARQTREEQGCQGYQVGEDVETPNRFVLVEQWTSMEAQYDHFRKPEFQALLASVGDVVAAPPEVTIHEVASTQTLDEALAAAGVGGER
jgi:quinol monooxygenase YgiN